MLSEENIIMPVDNLFDQSYRYAMIKERSITSDQSMKPELNLMQLELIVSEIKHLQEQHPKANVTYDTEKYRINITYPLPADFHKPYKMSSDFI